MKRTQRHVHRQARATREALAPAATAARVQPLRFWPAALAAALVACAAVAAHAPAYSAKALCFDDNQYLMDNVLVKNPSLHAAGRFMGEIMKPSTVRGYYQPLSMISLMVDYRLGARATDPRIFHAVSLGLHAANAALIVVLLYLLFGNAPVAGLVGLLFAVHPMMVDAVAWISERKTLLATLFALAALACYVLHARRGQGGAAGRKDESLKKGQNKSGSAVFSLWLLAALVLYVLAVGAKPTAVMLPAAMALLDVWPLRRWNARAATEKMPFAPLAILAAFVTFFSQKNTANLFMPGQNTEMKVLTVFHNVVFYPMKLLWPSGLTAHYPYPEPMIMAHPAVLAGVLGTVALAAALWLSWRRTRAAATGFAIFFALLAPTMGIVGFNNVPACNKFVYLPVVGLLAALAALGCWLWQHGAGRTRWLTRAAVVIVPLLLAAGETASTRQYLTWWRDTETLYRHMLVLAPNATYVREDLANELSRLEKYDEAVAMYEKAMTQREPAHASQARLNYNLALTLSRRLRPGDLEAAIVHGRKAVEMNPRNGRWHLGLGTLLRQQGQRKDAIAEFNAAIALSPESYESHCNLGLALMDERRWDEAIRACRRALELYPDYALGYLGLGVAQNGKGDTAAGASALIRAADLARRTGQREIEQLALQHLAAPRAAGGSAPTTAPAK